MLSARTVFVTAVVCSLPFAGCGGAGEAPTVTVVATAQATATPLPEATAVESRDATPGIKPADSKEPAAGICAGPIDGPIVTIEIDQDVPTPRCSLVRPDQGVRFVNHLGEPVQLTLGRYSGTAPANGDLLFDVPVSSYLGPGNHVVDASAPTGRAEVFVVEGTTP